VLEQGPGLGAAVEALLELPLVRGQAAIHLAGADREEVALDGAGELQAAPGPRQPEREQCLEAYGPRIAGCLPDHPERLNDGQPVRGGAPTPGAGVVVARGGPVQQAHGMLPVIAGDPAALIQDPALLRARRLPIAAMNRLEVLPSRVRSHDVTLLGAVRGLGHSHITNGATILAR